MEKISKNIDSIASEERFKRSLRNKEARRLSGPEKTFASMINTAGRKAYFDEYFYGIPLEDQELPQIEGISDIKATQTFQEGYQRGAFLVSVGNVPEEYQNINNVINTDRNDIMSIKLDRLNHILTEEISKVISEEVKDTDVQFVTITAVDISSDLSYAKVYFTNLIDKDREKVTKALNNASSFIRGKLFGRVEIRKMPELTFVYDESIEYGNKIEKIIEEIKEDGE